jgi:alpha-beta hydrolase superfamily lysophospholipase
VSHLLVGAFFLAWIAIDLTHTVAYHRALAQSGGLGDHSDASYHLAYHLRYNGMGAPIGARLGHGRTGALSERGHGDADRDFRLRLAGRAGR